MVGDSHTMVYHATGKKNEEVRDVLLGKNLQDLIKQERKKNPHRTKNYLYLLCKREEATIS